MNKSNLIVMYFLVVTCLSVKGMDEGRLHYNTHSFRKKLDHQALSASDRLNRVINELSLIEADSQTIEADSQTKIRGGDVPIYTPINMTFQEVRLALDKMAERGNPKKEAAARQILMAKAAQAEEQRKRLALLQAAKEEEARRLQAQADQDSSDNESDSDSCQSDCNCNCCKEDNRDKILRAISYLKKERLGIGAIQQLTSPKKSF